MTDDARFPEQNGSRADGRVPARAIVALSILAVCLGYAFSVPSKGHFEMIDHRVFLRATELMRGGQGYYPAMDQALREVYGPLESIRAFRMPTLFLFWSRLPSPSWIWAAYVAVVVITGLLLLNLTEIPVLALIPVIYLLNNATTRHAGEWATQFTATELWAVLFLAATFVAYRSGRNRTGAAFALMAALVRETTAGVLLGGLVAAYSDRRPLAPWLTATVLAGIAFAVHAACVSQYLVPPGEGRETPLLGTGGPVAALKMAGFGLPAGEVVGPALWLLAIAFTLRRGSRERILAPHLALPLTGLLADRPYWGLLIVPFTLLLAGNAVRSFLVRRLQAGSAANSRRDEPKAP